MNECNTDVIIYTPKKSDIGIDFYFRNQVCTDLGITRPTLNRYDSLLAVTIPSYRIARLGDRQPLSKYQLWAIKKLQTIIRKGIKGKGLRQYLSHNSHLLSYGEYKNEIA